MPDDKAHIEAQLDTLIQKSHQKEIDDVQARADISGKVDRLGTLVKTENDKTTAHFDAKFSLLEQKFAAMESRMADVESWQEGATNKVIGAVITIVCGVIVASLVYAFTH